MNIDLLDQWVLMSLLSAAAWGLSCVIDICFVAEGIYRRPSDGPAIAGFFCAVPALMATGSIDWSTISLTLALTGSLAGVLFLLHIHFYFKALFALNDAVNAEIFNTLGVLLVPLLAFLLLGERLAAMNYLAIAIGAIAVILLIAMQATRLCRRSLSYLAASVTSVSLLMVLQARVLELTNYATAIWLFSITAFITSVIVFGTRKESRRRLGSLCRRFGILFITVQLLELGAILGSQRATDLGPSVSLVALLECSLPLFVMTFSWLLIPVARSVQPIASRSLASALAEQILAAPSKLASMVLIVIAIGMVQLDA